MNKIKLINFKILYGQLSFLLFSESNKKIDKKILVIIINNLMGILIYQ